MYEIPLEELFHLFFGFCPLFCCMLPYLEKIAKRYITPDDENFIARFVTILSLFITLSLVFL